MNVVTITTIHVPYVLEDLCKNMVKHKREAQVYVIGDKKSPDKEIGKLIKYLYEKYDVTISYFDTEIQPKIFQDKLSEFFPFNTPDRVILGCMFAYQNGADRVIALDDDNFPTEDDFIGSHEWAGSFEYRTFFRNDLGWFNVHSMLQEENDIEFYPRGYPWSKRVNGSGDFVASMGTKRTIINQGLVLGDSDIDAIQRLAQPTNALRNKYGQLGHFGLFKTWSPFNFQNTCLSREMIPLYYRPRCATRNSDIWTSYLYNKLAEHFGDLITFGAPLVTQIRNNHNLWDDLKLELPVDELTDDFVELVRNTELTEKTYYGAMRELVEKCLPDSMDCGLIGKFFIEYNEWLIAVEEFL